MEPSRKLIQLRPWQILVFILLLCLVILCARFCAFQARTYIQEKAEDAAVWILQEQTITRGSGLQLIDNQLRYAASFGLGLTDAEVESQLAAVNNSEQAQLAALDLEILKSTEE